MPNTPFDTPADDEHDDIVYPSAIPFVLVHLVCFAAIWTGITWQALTICIAQPPQRMAGRRLRQPDPHCGAADIAFQQQRVERHQQVEVERSQIHVTNIYHMKHRLEE